VVVAQRTVVGWRAARGTSGRTVRRTVAGKWRGAGRRGRRNGGRVRSLDESRDGANGTFLADSVRDIPGVYPHGELDWKVLRNVLQTRGFGSVVDDGVHFGVDSDTAVAAPFVRVMDVPVLSEPFSKQVTES